MNAQEMEASLRARQTRLDQIAAENAELRNRSRQQEQVVQGLCQEIVTKLSGVKQTEKLDTKGVAKPVASENDEGKFKEWREVAKVAESQKEIAAEFPGEEKLQIERAEKLVYTKGVAEPVEAENDKDKYKE